MGRFIIGALAQIPEKPASEPDRTLAGPLDSSPSAALVPGG